MISILLPPNLMDKELSKPILSAVSEKNSPQDCPFEIGEKYYIRTVTHHQTGRVREIRGKFLVLEQAAWIADSGRFMNAILKGILNEVEPVGKIFVNMDAIVDACPWVHDLPTKQI